MSKNVLFIHSLFRSGSTYLFSKFRNSSDNIYCYQEPLNEYVFKSLDRPEALLELNGTSAMQRLLKHPEMKLPYFYELFHTIEFWKPFAYPEISFDDYFGLYAPTKTNEYLSALINAPEQDNILIQECRTGARIGNIKSKLGGHHVYLRRNPVDQWWSFKAAEYFEVIIHVIASAKSIPPIIHKICDENGISILPTHSFDQQLRHFEQRWVSPQNSYMLFFSLWCLNIIEALKNADIILSIDKLSNQDEYRRDIEDKLSKMGFSVDFSDCNIPQSTFTSTEIEFYRQIEEKVYTYLTETGTEESVVEVLRGLAQESSSIISDSKAVPVSDYKYLQSIESLRAVIFRGQTARELEGKSSNTEISILNERVLALREELNQSHQKISDLDVVKTELKDTLIASEKALIQGENEVAQLTRQFREVEILYKETKSEKNDYKKSLTNQAKSLETLSKTIDVFSKQNIDIQSRLDSTQLDIEKSREHYEFLSREHEALIGFLSTVEKKLRDNFEAREVKYIKALSEHENTSALWQKTESSLRAQNRELNKSVEEKNAVLTEILSSNSWKVTGPIRSVLSSKRHLKSFAKGIFLRLLSLSRSSPFFKSLAVFILKFVPSLKPTISSLVSSNPPHPAKSSAWNLQVDDDVAQKWLEVLKKGDLT